MTLPAFDAAAALRRHVYFLLAAASVGAMLGRILAVDSIDMIVLERSRVEKEIAPFRKDLAAQGLAESEIKSRVAAREEQLRGQFRLRRPFLSANDRSRWCAVRALVDPDMRVPGAPYAIDKVIQQPGWDTIDMVKHDGHLYSSKPPLFSTVMAVPYWLIWKLTGATLATAPYAIDRTLLVLFNVLPMAACFWLVAKLAERFGTTDWGRVFVVAAATFGTLLTAFAAAINNHIPAAACAAATLYAAVRIWCDGERRWSYFACAGFFGALTVAEELPALALAAAVGAALLWKSPRATLGAALPGALLVVVPFFATNWIAHQSLRPPYMHRSETDPDDNWYHYQYQRGTETKPSYWDNRQGIDAGEPSRANYALHVLVGHHGVFSLSPVWCLSVLGVGLWLIRTGDRRLRDMAMLIAAVSVVVVGFYLLRPLEDRNYSGMSCGLRWLFWLAPLWLVAMLPAADAMAGRRSLRWLAGLLLALSALSATYPTWNPWTQPWIYDFLKSIGGL
jgi:hypothetical protein